MTDLAALHLVPFNLVVHYEPEDAAPVAADARQSQHPVRILTDDQAFLVEDGKITLVGKGEEIHV